MAFLASLDVGQEVGVQRRAPRRTLRLEHVLGSGAEVVIHDISTTGLLIETSAELSCGQSFEVDLGETGAREAAVIWNSGRFFGCQFQNAIPEAVVSAALLRSAYVLPPSEARQNGHQIHNYTDEEKLPRATRLWIILALASVPWLLAGLALWIS